MNKERANLLASVEKPETEKEIKKIFNTEKYEGIEELIELNSTSPMTRFPSTLEEMVPTAPSEILTAKDLYDAHYGDIPPEFCVKGTHKKESMTK